MNIWKSKNWQNYIETKKYNLRTGLRLNFQKGVDCEVRRACIEFANWLRSQYYFPIRVPVYFKSSRYLKTQLGELVSAKFFEPYDKMVEPYISIATGDIKDIELKYGKDEAIAAVLCSLIHELTHYYQWINNVILSDKQAERQAVFYKRKIIQEYAMTREHP